MPEVKAVLLAGGRGERLWPLSTPELPKAFLTLTGPDSLLRQTFQRVVPWLPPEAVYVVAAREHEALVRQHLPELPEANLILEPAGRSTAPALGLAALWLEGTDPATPLVVLPVDHWIGGERRFRAALEAAVAGARQGWVVTLGLRPTRPETGYGYIEVGEPLPRGMVGEPLVPGAGPDTHPGRGQGDGQGGSRGGEGGNGAGAGGPGGGFAAGHGVGRGGPGGGSSTGRGVGLPLYSARRFVEKPDPTQARELVASGRYWWNSGIFVLTREVLEQEIAEHLPDLHALLGEIRAGAATEGLAAAVDRLFPRAEAVSFDHGVCERSRRLAVVPALFDWNDIGDWAALGRVLPRDHRQNAAQGEVLLHDAEGLVVHAGTERLVVALGVQDLIIAETDEAVLVCHRDQAQGVREVGRWAEPLAGALARGRLPAGPVEERPWGREVRWASGPGYAARVLQVRPGSGLGPLAYPTRHETFWVQAGRGRLRVGEEWHPVGVGDVFAVPPGAVLHLQAVTLLTLVGVGAPETGEGAPPAPPAGRGQGG